ncbi:hypothetical protein FF38_06555 [Lucilia cuprina]|uniref:Uncharacterized protein n=1 Tax=Lucilia cuprina TaxID=7375 RepID=A0A0L0C4W7_LUCCU|nr:hypothetical protein FF38_06555 [Lucilia cuprina]
MKALTFGIREIETQTIFEMSIPELHRGRSQGASGSCLIDSLFWWISYDKLGYQFCRSTTTPFR